MTIEERNELIIDHMHLADKMAYSKKRQVPPSVHIDELKSAAYFGLVDAASRFDPKYKKFSPYASIRIMGAICDFLRELGWGSKSQYKVLFCAEEMPMESWLESKVSENFEEITENLNNRDKKVLYWYYIGGYNMSEVGAKIGVTESRVSQIIKAIKKQYDQV
jgi:RNA polymerase sigma factor (sigma-70 family)